MSGVFCESLDAASFFFRLPLMRLSQSHTPITFTPSLVLPFIQEATIFLLPASLTIVLLAIATLFNLNCASLLMSVW